MKIYHQIIHVVLVLITAGFLTGCVSSPQKPITTESDFVQFAKAYADAPPKEQYAGLRNYLKKHALPDDFIDKSLHGSTGSLHIEILGDFGVVCELGGYKIPSGFVAFIDISKNTIALLDPYYPFGDLSVETITNPDATPQILFSVKYRSGTGSGYSSFRLKIYAIDGEHLQLSLEKPCYELLSIWDPVEDPETYRLQQTNDFIVCDGFYLIQTSGTAEIGYTDPVVLPLPDEWYVWDPRTRQFDQVAGRLTHKKTKLSKVYADFVGNPNDDWLKDAAIIGH